MQPIEVENLFNQILQNMFTYDYGEYQSIPIVCVFSGHISGYVLFFIRLGFIYIFQYLQGSCGNIIYYMQPIEVENLFNQILQNMFTYSRQCCLTYL